MEGNTLIQALLLIDAAIKLCFEAEANSHTLGESAGFWLIRAISLLQPSHDASIVACKVLGRDGGRVGMDGLMALNKLAIYIATPTQIPDTCRVASLLGYALDMYQTAERLGDIGPNAGISALAWLTCAKGETGASEALYSLASEALIEDGFDTGQAAAAALQKAILCHKHYSLGCCSG